MLSIIIPIYVNLEIPEPELSYYNLMGAKRGVEVIIVDDGSPVKIPYSRYNYIKWKVIPYDIPWNQPEASNIGIRQSRFNKIFHCNIDCIVPLPTLEYLIKCEIRRGEVYRFKRVFKGKEIKPHPNIFLINKEDFTGFDTEFCGEYGHDDKYFFAKNNLKIKVINKKVISIPLKTHNLVRDRKNNETKFYKKLNAK